MTRKKLVTLGALGFGLVAALIFVFGRQNPPDVSDAVAVAVKAQLEPLSIPEAAAAPENEAVIPICLVSEEELDFDAINDEFEKTILRFHPSSSCTKEVRNCYEEDIAPDGQEAFKIRVGEVSCWFRSCRVPVGFGGNGADYIVEKVHDEWEWVDTKRSWIAQMYGEKVC